MLGGGGALLHPDGEGRGWSGSSSRSSRPFCSAGTSSAAGPTAASRQEAASSPHSRPPREARRSGGDDDLFEFTKFVSKDAQDMWTQIVPRRTGNTHAPGRDVHRRNADRLRAGVVRKRPLLLPGRQQGLPRPRSPGSCHGGSALPATSHGRTSSRTRSATTSRRCLGSRPRCGRSSRATRDANLYLVRLELQADCFAWACGSLLVPARNARGGRHRGRAHCRLGGRRRPPRRPESRAVDARLGGTPDGVVPQGLRVRRPGRLRHGKRGHRVALAAGRGGFARSVSVRCQAPVRVKSP